MSLIRTFSEDRNEDWVNSVSWSPDGTKIASATHNYIVKISNAQTYEVIHTIDVSNKYSKDYYMYSSITWTPDNTKIVIVYDTEDHINNKTDEHIIIKGVIICDAKNGKEITNLYSTCLPILSPDGKMLVTASLNGNLKIRDMNTGNCIYTQTKYNNKYMFVYGDNNEDDSCFSQIKIPEYGYIYSITWNPDGKIIIVSRYENTTIWDVSKL